VFFLTGCGEKKDASTDYDYDMEEADQINWDTDTEDYSDWDDMETEKEASAVIRENGKLPDDPEELTEDEVAYYAGLTFTAVQELDCDTLALFTDESIIDDLRAVKEDPTALEWWNRIIGELMYFPKEDVLIGKSFRYIFSSWYTDCVENNVPLPESIEDLTLEEAQAIYDKYYESAPYEAVDGLVYHLDYTVEDGYFRCFISEIFYDLHNADLSDCLRQTWDSYGPLNASVLLLGESGSLNDESYIRKEFPEYEQILSMNLSSLTEILTPYFEEDSSGILGAYFEEYLVNENNRAILQKYFTENCTIKRGPVWLSLFMPVDLEYSYPVYLLSEDEKEQIAELNLINFRSISGLSKTYDFNSYYELIKLLIDKGILEATTDIP